jgi:hypothetical protein
MSIPPSDPPAQAKAKGGSQPTAADVRAARLKLALKANMARRKAQQRARSAEDETGPDESRPDDTTTGSGPQQQRD